MVVVWYVVVVVRMVRLKVVECGSGSGGSEDGASDGGDDGDDIDGDECRSGGGDGIDR